VPHAVARRYDVPQAYADHSQVLTEELVEAVLVAAPNRFHYPIAAAALSAGKHVLVEKPLASTVADSEKLVDLVEQTGLVLQVGAMKRHDPACSTRGSS